MFGALLKLVIQIFSKKSPASKMKPDRIISNQATKKKEQPKTQRLSKGDKKNDQQSDDFWKDRIESEGNDARQKFYLKHRERLQNQDRDPGQQR